MESEESHLIRERREKLSSLRERGIEPYPWTFPNRVPCSSVIEAVRHLAAGEVLPDRSFRVAGRLRAVRSHGRSCFLDMDDLSASLQLFARVDELGESAYSEWMALLDPGDLIGADGHAMVTKRGEPSLRVSSMTLLAKAVRPPPEKFHGLKDPEVRLRRRYVDLLATRESRSRFVARSGLLSEMRRFLEERGFLEFETNVLQPTASGAAASPFVTRSRYLDGELQLRIALELALKRLLVGGLERVFELGKVFRNEDLDSTHAPEFTMLELYWAYADYTDMRGLVEALYERLAVKAKELLPDVPAAAEAPTVFRPPFRTVDYVEELENRSGIQGILSKNPEELARLARDVGAKVPADSPPGRFLDKLFEHYVEPHLTTPTFVMDFPAVTTPLAKRHRSLPGRVERFELFYRGIELGNAYTELNDPQEQEARFREQLNAKDPDTYALDEDFIEALEYGMPPATGIGIGVDRMAMALTGAASIKDVILFVPTRERSIGDS